MELRSYSRGGYYPDSRGESAIYNYKDTVQRKDDGMYTVRLPKKQGASQLGESRYLAENRFLLNEKALKQKGTWKQFEDGVQEYIRMGHAEEVTQDDLKKPATGTYYFPCMGLQRSHQPPPNSESY